MRRDTGYGIVFGDGRENTVDASATRSNTIGAPKWITVRTDPEFDPETPGFSRFRRRVPADLGKRTKRRIDQIRETLTALGKI